MALARLMAAEGCHLVLVARRESRLQDLANELSESHGVKTHCLPMDLGLAKAPEVLADRLKDYDISIIANNAGFAMTGKFASADPARLEQMVALNIRFVMQFTRLMLPRLLERDKPGRILNTGSVAGHQGVPHFAAYAATKAFVNHFSEGLAWEVRRSKVRICTIEPGQTASEFFQVAEMEDSFISRFAVLTTNQVAKAGVRALKTGKPRTVVGLLNKLLVFSLRITPRSLVRIVISMLFKDLAK